MGLLNLFFGVECMRIITGRAKGCRLKTPKGQETRPTADRIKESVFNILGDKVYGRNVLDLFAGTGSLGLEALSRGAAHAVLVDQATSAILRENALHTRLEECSEVWKGDVFSAMARMAGEQRVFDLVFCDPPYRRGLWEKVLSFLDASDLFAENGILVVEHGADEADIPALNSLVCVRGERYGHTTRLSFFQRRSYVGGDED